MSITITFNSTKSQMTAKIKINNANVGNLLLILMKEIVVL